MNPYSKLMTHKLSFFSLLFLLLGSSLWAQQTTYSLDPTSTFSVVGTSTMHDWTATTSEITGEISLENSLSSLENAPEGNSVGSVSLDITVASLDGGRGKIMNDKIKKALKATEHPDIQYNLTSGTISEVATEEAGLFTLLTTGTLSMSGAKKEVEISLAGKLLDNQAFSFEGEYAMKMSEFGITPPSAMFGQIQTDDDVVVKFSLVLQPNP